jgi:hypothetical protein
MYKTKTSTLQITDEQAKREIIRIRRLFGFTAKKMCEFMNMNHQTFRNNCNNSNPTNNFKPVDYFRLKSELSKIINIYNHDSN